MKREAKLLLEKACDSLVLSIELFNRPHDRGRISGTLIQLDHGFEMLLKAAILHRGGSIRENRAKETIGFDACVRRSLSDGKIKYLTKEQALVLQTINGLRDAAQHHLLDISEGQLYVHIQSGVTLFKDLLKSVFNQDLSSYLPNRVLPVSSSPPTDLATLFDSEVTEIKSFFVRVADAESMPCRDFDPSLFWIAPYAEKRVNRATRICGASATRCWREGHGTTCSREQRQSRFRPTALAQAYLSD